MRGNDDQINSSGKRVTILRERPYASCNFLVDFGDGKAWTASGGFSEVIFPEFVIESGKKPTARAQKIPLDPVSARQSKNLLLKRGAIGTLDLYAWWNAARLGKAAKRRALAVHLLGDDHRTVVMSWRFANVRPVALAYTPLRANETAILIESIELAFDRMEMATPAPQTTTRRAAKSSKR